MIDPGDDYDDDDDDDDDNNNNNNNKQICKCDKTQFFQYPQKTAI